MFRGYKVKKIMKEDCMVFEKTANEFAKMRMLRASAGENEKMRPFENDFSMRKTNRTAVCWFNGKKLTAITPYYFYIIVISAVCAFRDVQFPNRKIKALKSSSTALFELQKIFQWKFSASLKFSFLKVLDFWTLRGVVFFTFFLVKKITDSKRIATLTMKINILLAPPPPPRPPSQLKFKFSKKWRFLCQ